MPVYVLSWLRGAERKFRTTVTSSTDWRADGADPRSTMTGDGVRKGKEGVDDVGDCGQTDLLHSQLPSGCLFCGHARLAATKMRAVSASPTRHSMQVRASPASNAMSTSDFLANRHFGAASKRHGLFTRL